jgi:hypothetical protein
MSNSFMAVHTAMNALRLLRKQTRVTVRVEIVPGVAIETTKSAVYHLLRALDRLGIHVEYRYVERTSLKVPNWVYRDVYLRAIPK